MVGGGHHLGIAAIVDRHVLDVHGVDLDAAESPGRAHLQIVDHPVFHVEIVARIQRGVDHALFDGGLATAEVGDVLFVPTGAAPDDGIVQPDVVPRVERAARTHDDVVGDVVVAEADAAAVFDRNARVGGGAGRFGVVGRRHRTAACHGDVGHGEFCIHLQRLGVDVFGVVLRVGDGDRTGQLCRLSVGLSLSVTHFEYSFYPSFSGFKYTDIVF